MHLVVLAFIGVRSFKHTIYILCDAELVFPYVFFFVFRIARSRTVWVTVIFKAWFLNVSHLVFFIACEIYFLSVLSKRSIRSKERASWTWLREINTVLKMAVFGKSCWNVDTWKMLLSVLKRYFFGFIKALASKGILNTLKKWITSAMESADLAAFTFATWQMRSLTL